MDASAALSELLALSTQVVEAVVMGPDGAVEAARTAGDERARGLAAVGAELLTEASSLRPEVAVERVHVDLGRGSLVAVSDGARTIVASTVPEPTAGLVAFDLRTALRRMAEDDA
jgi:predicted regulator of Ras-like GTPase activity (Roadblock/LC7/MglB family)